MVSEQDVSVLFSYEQCVVKLMAYTTDSDAKSMKHPCTLWILNERSHILDNSTKSYMLVEIHKSYREISNKFN